MIEIIMIKPIFDMVSPQTVKKCDTSRDVYKEKKTFLLSINQPAQES